MNILNKVNESKRRMQIMTGIGIDWQYAQQLIPTILNETTPRSEEFHKGATALRMLLENMEEGIREIKGLIPLGDQ